MAYYIKLDLEQIKSILTSYNLQIIEVSPIAGGAGNSSFLLKTDKEKLIFTIFEELLFNEVKNLAKLLSYFAKNDIKTNRVIKNLDGEDVILVEGKPAMLKAFVNGEVISDLSDNQMFQIGVELARINLLSTPTYLPKNHNYGIDKYLQIANNSIDPKFESWLVDKVSQIEQFPISELPKGLIHSDLFSDNILFKGDNLAAIIDFEGSCDFPLIFDLGMAIVGCCVKEGELNLQGAKNLINGYQSVRLLKTLEKENLINFAIFSATATAYWRYWKYNIRFQIPEKNKTHWDMVDITEMLSNIEIDSLFGR